MMVLVIPVRACLLHGQTEQSEITTGVPQGSILGPPFFIYYVYLFYANEHKNNMQCGHVC